MIFQDLSLFPDLTVAENIAFDPAPSGLRSVNRGRTSPPRAPRSRGSASRSIRRAQVGDLLDPQRQLVAICRALAAEARLVIMDEPTASLTRAEVDALLGIARELKRRGIAVVFVSHRLDEMLEIAERVTVIRDGRKLGTCECEEMTPRRLGSLMTGHRIRLYDHGARHVRVAVVHP